METVTDVWSDFLNRILERMSGKVAEKRLSQVSYSVTNRVHVFSPLGNGILLIASRTLLFPED
jgi:hypothetical protein